MGIPTTAFSCAAGKCRLRLSERVVFALDKQVGRSRDQSEGRERHSAGPPAGTDEIPEDIVRANVKELGLFGLAIPEEYDGLGFTMKEECWSFLAMSQASPAPVATAHAIDAMRSRVISPSSVASI
jgi:alkylation response protein AidB-like acyl-CoA dehydrogenase